MPEQYDMEDPDDRRAQNINDPDLQSSEQYDEDAEAQQVASDAARIGTASFGESEHGGRANPAQITPDDVEDLVDHMKQMERSGHIDMDAFRGEPESMDDEDGSLPD
jgi:hypothetical protein